MKIVPVKWAEFQHYKDRAPPWIKLHKGLLDNPKWHRLQLASRAIAPLLWLLASEKKDGVIEESADDIAFRLRCTTEELESAVKDLIEKDFFIDLESGASKPLAPRQQHAAPEERRDRGEKEGEADGATGKPAAAKPEEPNPLNANTWKAYKAAFVGKYRVDPVRDAKANSLIRQFVQRLGAEAPAVAAFYLTSQKPFHVQKSHALQPMLADAEGLRTEWAQSNNVKAASHVQRPAVEAA
jgi:hypothetical protein